MKKVKVTSVKKDPRKFCPLCKGSGLDLNDREASCPKCEGSGRVGLLKTKK